MPSYESDRLARLAFADYRPLMQRRIRRILLVCNSYDGFTLEEDGRIETRIAEEYDQLNLSNPPSLKRVSTTGEAFDLLASEKDFDLVITMYNVGGFDPFAFAGEVKESYPHIPVVLLTNFSKTIARKIREHDTTDIDYVFFWYGSADLIIAIIKIIEDRMNADADILEAGVQAILLVEDSVRYYSTYLPTIYRLILQQTGESLKEALNERQQVMTKRARPKILLATNYSEAVGLYEKYKENLLGVISDVGFVLDRNDPPESEKLDAGLDLCRLIRRDNPFMPFLLQSSQESMRPNARALGAGFLAKYSKTLLLELSDYISSEFAFGDFVFKDPRRGTVIGRAKNLRQLQTMIEEVPEEVLLYHTSQNHLSKWMNSRGLFYLGSEFKAIDAGSFSSVEQMREFIAGRINDYRIYAGQGVVASFDRETYDDTIWFARIGNGSIGGKARGLAFLNKMLRRYGFYGRYENTRVVVPRTVVVATDLFDRFIRDNGLQYVIGSEISDEEILSEFVSSRLPQNLVDDLRAFVRHVRGPLAIRSSSKLEDSFYQPFAGVYSTYMIPLTENEDQLLRLLGKAVKSVYASMFFASSRAYIAATGNVLSEEKMAVVIQEVCGSADGDYFFPTLSGVARSVNFYPIGDEKADEGIVQLAFGLGKTVVDGDRALRFSPRHPKRVFQLSTPQMALGDTQNAMYALDLSPEKFKTSIDDAVNLERFDIQAARGFRNMRYAASTWDPSSGRLWDTWEGEGRKVVTFAPVLKYDGFPLARILSDLLEMGQKEMQCPVEIEFAADLDTDDGMPRLFNTLQIRPIAADSTETPADWSRIDVSDAIVCAENALGTGVIDGIRDVVYVKAAAFDKLRTREIAEQLAVINAGFRTRGEGYVLIGYGRWGSSDPFLGIPVSWIQISEARVIVECGLKDFSVEPSQGTHFFQNLTSFGVGYITVNPQRGEGVCDLARLDALSAVSETEFVRHVRFGSPLTVIVDGMKSRGLVK